MQKYLHLHRLLDKLLNKIDNFEIYYPTPDEINLAMQCVLKYDGTLALADCLAVLIMEKRGISEIVSFDDDFDKVDGIIRVH